MAAKRDIELEYMAERLDSVYKERNMCVSLIARLALALGLEVGIKAHEGQPNDWDAEWQNVLFVKLPSGQVSWHLRESDVRDPIAKAMGLDLNSTATLHTDEGVQLWLQRSIHQGILTKYPYSSSLAE